MLGKTENAKEDRCIGDHALILGTLCDIEGYRNVNYWQTHTHTRRQGRGEGVGLVEDALFVRTPFPRSA